MTPIDIRVILPIISIVAFGSFGVEVLRKKILRIKEKVSFFEHLLESIVLGSILLIIPMLIIAIISDAIGSSKLLERFIYIFLAISLVYIIYKIYAWVRKRLPSLMLSEKRKIPQSLEILLTVIVVLMFFFYCLQALVYPLRGWDFLHFYLPNSFRIYVTGQLGQINELNFLPQFKPPANVLLYAFTFFVTQSEMVHLVPMLFMAGTVYLCYRIAILEGLTKKNSLFAAIAFLATPLTFFLVYEFQYYQETYIMFFATASFYFFRTFFKKENFNQKFFYALLTSLSLCGAILSKISGFIIPLLLLVAMPSDKVGKIFRIMIIAGFSYQLIRKSIFDIYLGTGILIGLLSVYSIYLVLSSETLSFSYKRYLYILGIFALPLLTGILWVLHILQIPGVEKFLINLYITPSENVVNLQWIGISLPETVTYLENAHTATFFSSAFSIFIASMFAGTWLLFKVTGIIKSSKRHKELLLWLVFFYSFWQAFFGMGSIRYLSPILVPVAIIFIIGLDSVLSFLNKRDGKDRDGFLAYIFIIASSYLSLYPILPFEIIKEDFHLRWYHAHTRLGSLIGYILLFNLITFILLWKERELKISYSLVYVKKFNFRKIISSFLVFIVFFVPFGAQAALLAYEKFDFDAFQTNYTHEYRFTYQQLVDAINRLGFSDDQVVLSINTPGLEYYTSQPVIDLFIVGLVTESGFYNSTFPLQIQNVTRILEFFENYQVSIFVALNSSNDWYPAYIEHVYWNYMIYRFLHNNIYFNYRFTNEEYILFTLESTEPYIGPVDLQLVGEKRKGSILAYAPNPILIDSNTATIDTTIDLTAVPTNDPINVSVSTQYTIFPNITPTINTVFHTFERPTSESFSRISLLSLPTDPVQLMSITMSIQYKNLEGLVQELTFNLNPLIGNSVNITSDMESWFYSGYNGFTFV